MAGWIAAVFPRRSASAVTVALIGLAALVAACLQATTGLGFALLLSPVLFAYLPPTGAIVTVTALGLALNLLVLLAERRRPSVAWAQVAPILAAAVPGIVSGVFLLQAVPKPALQIGVGLAIIVATLLRLRAGPSAAGPSRVPMRLTVGFLTGVLTTSAGISGPPLALWLSRRGLPPSELRDTLSVMFLVIGAIAGLALVPVLRRAQLDPPLLAAALICVIAGHALGSRAFARLSARPYQPLLLAVILIAGVASIAAGASAL